MKRPAQLSATFVKTAAAPDRYGDGRGGYGLSLLMKPTKVDRLSKTWAQRIRADGRAHNIGLGSYPEQVSVTAYMEPFRKPAVASLAEPHHERITRWWRQGIQGATIHGALVHGHGFTGSYLNRSVRP